MIGSHAGPQQLTVLIVLSALLAAMPTAARAASSGGAPAAYSSAVTGGAPASPPAKHPSPGCGVGSTLLNTLNPFSHCNPARQALGAAASIPGELAGAAASGIMDEVTGWMVQAAQTISGWVVKEAGTITHPDLEASWYLRLFSGLAALGGALAGLVGLIALASAAVRKDPDALGEVIYGVARAGIGTSVVIALTIIALSAADWISNQFAQQMPADFYKTLAEQWGGSGWGGFGAAALAFLVAFVATIAGLLVWLELIVREAAIYIAVLFFPVGLAASIWPAPAQLGQAALDAAFDVRAAAAGGRDRARVGRERHRVRVVVWHRFDPALGGDDPGRRGDLRAGRVHAVDADVPAGNRDRGDVQPGRREWRAGSAQLGRQPAGRGRPHRRAGPGRRRAGHGRRRRSGCGRRSERGDAADQPGWLGIGSGGGVGRVDRRCGRMGGGGRRGGIACGRPARAARRRSDSGRWGTERRNAGRFVCSRRRRLRRRAPLAPTRAPPSPGLPSHRAGVGIRRRRAEALAQATKRVARQPRPAQVRRWTAPSRPHPRRRHRGSG